MWHLALGVLFFALAFPVLAQTKPGDPPPFETLKDAYDRQRAEDARARSDSRSLLQNDRSTPLGDSRVNAVPAPERYTTQPVPNRK
jgi:hypothetical protein